MQYLLSWPTYHLSWRPFDHVRNCVIHDLCQVIGLAGHGHFALYRSALAHRSLPSCQDGGTADSARAERECGPFWKAQLCYISLTLNLAGRHGSGVRKAL
jgi:hypothetical protein